MMVWFRIDFHSGKPIYEQIKEGLKELIARSILKVGDPLPSVREFAKILGVNVNTVVKAYRELEMEGIVLPRKGVGYFVNLDEAKVKEAILRDVKERLVQILRDMRKMGLSKDEMMRMIRGLVSEVED